MENDVDRESITGILVNKLFTSRLAITSLLTFNLDIRSKKEKVFFTAALCSRNSESISDNQEAVS